tara:strand:+ start:116 stop:922 length:807 start_codon:yes stop_codon:yes gene_type:complete
MNTTVIMVAFKSESLIFKNIENFSNKIKIIIVENSGNYSLKEKIEAKYKNTKVILNENKGFGQAANLGAEYANTKYLLFCSPDNIVEDNAVEKLEQIGRELNDNFGLLVLSDVNERQNLKVKITTVTGILCFFAVRDNFMKLDGFDENFFLYYEDNDLVKRLLKNNENIYKVPINYKNLLGSHNKEFNFPIEVNRNWHLMWSKFYFKKKHYGYIYAFLSTFPYLIRALIKILIFSKNPLQKEIYCARVNGLYNAYMSKKSWYRPKINQ